MMVDDKRRIFASTRVRRNMFGSNLWDFLSVFNVAMMTKNEEEEVGCALDNINTTKDRATAMTTCCLFKVQRKSAKEVSE